MGQALQLCQRTDSTTKRVPTIDTVTDTPSPPSKSRSMDQKDVKKTVQRDLFTKLSDGKSKTDYEKPLGNSTEVEREVKDIVEEEAEAQATSSEDLVATENLPTSATHIEQVEEVLAVAEENDTEIKSSSDTKEHEGVPIPIEKDHIEKIAKPEEAFRVHVQNKIQKYSIFELCKIDYIRNTATTSPASTNNDMVERSHRPRLNLSYSGNPALGLVQTAKFAVLELIPNYISKHRVNERRCLSKI